MALSAAWPFDTSDFPARWDCGDWPPWLGWLHIASDLLIWLAYLAIPLVIVYFVRRRREVPFLFLFWLFGAFIATCGTTHLLEAVIFYAPVYRLAGVVKLATALASWATVIALVPALPRALAMRAQQEMEREVSARTAELASSNAALRLEGEERGRAEGLLRASEARFRNFVEQAGDGFFLYARDGTVLDVNRRACEMLGYAKGELVGMNVTAIDPDVTEARFAEAAGELDAGRLVTIESSSRRRDGSTFPVEVRLSPFDSDERRLCLALVRDATERKRAEAALGESVSRYRTLFEYAPDGIVVTDPEGRYLEANASMCRMLGRGRAQLIGGYGSDVVAPAEVRHVAPALSEVSGGADHQREWQLRRKDGSAFAADVSGTRMPDGNLLWLVHDVTSRKGLEEQLRQSQKMEVVGKLAGGVAHDFNNLLCVINGYGELLLGRLPEGDPARDMIREMTKAGERAAGLTRQLLTFSRKAIVAPEVLDLNSLVADLEKMLRRTIGEDVDVDLGVSLQPGMGRVKANPGQVEQVLMNLCVNARDAMPRGGRLTIETSDAELDEDYARTHLGARPGRHVLLAVSDTGTGMTPEVKARIFEPFFTTKEVGKGTGLGLSTVFGIVKQSGGSVEVFSESGRGTAFKVYLPRVEEEAARQRARADQSPGPRGAETVLLVEDEVAVRALARIVLTNSGYAVLEASHGAEGLRVAERHQGPIHLLAWIAHRV